jgi:hypothetical protein
MTATHKTLLTICGLLAIVIGFRAWLGFRSQPQLPPSPEVFSTVDALFTAVTAHDQQRLAACAQRLETYKAAGSLPSSAAKRLDSVITTARAGQWESAAKRLYDFMHGQRRDAPTAHARPGQTAMNIK